MSDDDAFAVGLTCGGTIEVFVQPVTPGSFPELVEVAAADAERRPAAVATVIAGAADLGSRVVLREDEVWGTVSDPGLAHSVTELADGLRSQGRNGVLHLGAHGEHRMEEVTVFVESFAPSPEMIVFGAIDFAAAVVRVGKFLGYHVTLCDARAVFATSKRFPDADEIVVQWPHDYLANREVDERTVLCVLTHDPKFDVPLLVEALGTRAGYIGAMGSRRTHEDRTARLREEGVSEEDLARLSSPIGLDLGGRTPEETAIAIAGEIIARHRGGTGMPLADVSTPIHL